MALSLQTIQYPSLWEIWGPEQEPKTKSFSLYGPFYRAVG